MDQLKIVAAVLKKHHFWLLCGAVVAVGLALWWPATRAVDKQREARAAEIAGDLQRLQQITATPGHPNQSVIEAIRAATEKNKQQVLEAWQRLYQLQKDKNPLPDLTNEFKLWFESLEQQPIGGGLGQPVDPASPAAQPELEASFGFRDEYRNFIGRHIPKLFEMVDMLRPAPVAEGAADAEESGSTRPPTGPGDILISPAAGAGRSAAYNPATGRGFSTGAAGEAGEYGMRIVGVVDWAEADRNRLIQRFSWPSSVVPTVEEVRLAQEDLWVYEALLRIIKATNGSVKTPRDAAIKQIQALEIGRDAAMAWQGAAPAGGYGGGYRPGPRPGAGPGGSGTSFDGYTRGAGTPATGAPVAPPAAGAGGFGPQQPPSLTDFRYVDQDGNPLGAADEPPFAEFRLMPIRMLLVMNQTRLSRLLVECANSSMPVEVRSVSVGTDQGAMPNMGVPAQVAPPPGVLPGGVRGHAGLPGSGGYDGYGVRRGGYSSGYSGYARGPYGYGQPGGFGSTVAPQSGALDVPVEIRGTICIYNPPNKDKLGTGAAAKAPADVTPATPAQAPPVTPGPTAPAQPLPVTPAPTAPAQPPAATPGPTTPTPTQAPPVTPGPAAPTQPPPATPQPTGAGPAGGPAAGGPPPTTGP